MLLLSFNKAGLWPTSMLLLLGSTLYPACGRPSFEDAEPLEDEDQDDDQADDQDEDENEEENDSDATKYDGSECKDLKGQEKTDCLLISMFELQQAAAAAKEKAKQSSTSGSDSKSKSKQRS